MITKTITFENIPEAFGASNLEEMYAMGMNYQETKTIINDDGVSETIDNPQSKEEFGIQELRKHIFETCKKGYLASESQKAEEAFDSLIS